MSDEIKPRIWWRAWLAQIFGGVGYIYLGRWKRFLILQAVTVAYFLAIFFGLGGALFNPWNFIILAICGVGLAILVFIDLVFIARKEQEYHLKAINQVWVYIVLSFAIYLLFNILFLFNQNHGSVRHLSVAASSMAPSFAPGDSILVDARAASIEASVAGDVIAISTDRGIIIKRLVARDGGVVEFKNNQPFVDGKAIEEAFIARLDQNNPGPESEVYAEFQKMTGAKIEFFTETSDAGLFYPIVLTNKQNQRIANVSPVELGRDQWYLVGDFRDNSADSRLDGGVGLGLVERTNVIGVARSYFYSHNPKKRFHRFKDVSPEAVLWGLNLE